MLRPSALYVSSLLTLACVGAGVGACGADEGPGREPTDSETLDTGVDGDTGGDTSSPDLADIEPDLEPEVDADDTLDPDGADTSDTTDDLGPDTGTDTVAPGPTCGDGLREGDEACDDGDLDDLDGCNRDCVTGAVVRPPRVGEVVLTELMIAPSRVADLLGEWIELTSMADEVVNLSGCALVDSGTDRVALDLEGGLVLSPGEVLVLGLSASPAENGGVVVDLAYATMLLEDSSDEVWLVCEGEGVNGSSEPPAPTLIDGVAWTPFEWPVIEGLSLSLDPSRADAEQNDRADSWCGALTRYGRGDRGSPGETNPSCPHLDRALDACRLVGPAIANGFRDSAVAFTIEVEELGLTDLTPGVDQSPRLVVELGHGPVPVGSPTSLELASFTWSRAQPEPGFAAPAGARYDRWVGRATSTDIGSRAVLGRASRDGGATWRFCDLNGAEPPTSLAVLEVAETPCTETSCTNPPPPACAADGVTLLVGGSPGRCTPTGPASFTCEYTTSATSCGASGRVCSSEGAEARCGAPADPPAPGELVIAEVMVSPTTSRDSRSGQWVELVNTADAPRLLTGCSLVHTAALGEDETFLIELPLVVGARELLVLGATTDTSVNGGADVDLAWGDTLELTNTSTLSLDCDAEIDTVVWNTTWPLQSGAALSLSPFSFDADRNDVSTAWCRADTDFGDGDRGTPGQANPRCPGDIVPIEACRVAGLARVTPPAGTESEVDLRVLVRSITGRTSRTDTSPKLWLEVGLVAANADPNTITTWRRASADTSWVSTGQGVDPAEDRYRGAYTAPAPGEWALFARATADGGNSYSLCDLDGLVLGDARPLSVAPVPSACSPSPCELAPRPICEPSAGGASTRIIERSSPSTCALSETGPVCGYVQTSGQDCGALGARCVEGVSGAICAGFPRPPVPGELVLSELMIAPVINGTSNELGEWIELTNVGDEPLDLTGCALRSDAQTVDGGVVVDAERFDLPDPTTPLGLVVAPGTAITFARSGTTSVNGSSQPRAIWSGLALGNAADRVALWCGEVEVAALAWEVATGWPIRSGQSLHLSGSYLDGRDTRFSNLWCASASPSPAAQNLSCPGDGVLDACRLLGEARTASADEAIHYEVELRDLGVTDLSPGNDPAIGVIVEVGVGDPALDPRTSLAWTWYAASPDPEWVDPASLDDRWIATFSPRRPAELALTAGDPSAFADLAVMARVSHDGGRTFRVCGATGFSDLPSTSLELTLTPGLCAPNPCRTPPASTCSGATVVGYSSPGLCTVNNGQASCQYPSRTFSCSAWGGCAAGRCNTPPASPTSPGALVITELMRDSGLPLPDRGEWVELRNTSATALDLRGCRFETASALSPPLSAPVPELINSSASGGHALFVQSTASDNGGIPAFFVPLRPLGIELPAATGTLRLTCNGTTIDQVTWVPGWPGRRGVAMQLDRSRATDSQNDLPTSWCEATSLYGSSGLRGSPGSLNNQCP